MAQMPMRIYHPPMDIEEWQNKTGSDPKTSHGAITMEVLAKSFMVFGASILLHEKRYPKADVLLMGQMRALIENVIGVN